MSAALSLIALNKNLLSYWCRQGENPEVRQARRLALLKIGLVPHLVKVRNDSGAH
jgi:hypothetical protein